ncbi:MAG TPA: hypothetical protein VK179_18355 [Bacteroidales bacterium]|nr:hypothetical protein [Bacteroidales bacterium]
MKNIGAAIIWILLFCNGIIQAQDSIPVSMKEQARKHFAAKEYKEALPVYRKLLNRYPKEPEYLYGTGVCLVNLNSGLEEAILFLKPSTVAEYNSLSLFYLGRAYHLSYAFEDAIKAYSKFMLKAGKTDIKRYDVERQIEMARNGIEFTKTSRTLTVQNTEEISPAQAQKITMINGSGKLIRKPVEFCTKTDLRNGYRSWMFLPSYTEVNDYIYVSGYDRYKKNNLQIFRVRNVNHETWGFPELVGDVINTPYDEEFPYFDTKTSTLYFCSKGHSSMGGYDIFKSVYDWNTKTWSKPENAGFPINSPFDDYIYLVDEFSHTASFISNRDSKPGFLKIYRVKTDEEGPAARLASIEDIRKASILEPSEISKPVAEVVADTFAVADAPRITKNDYNKVLAEALLLQVKADSCARITRDLRILAKETPDDSLKKQLVKDILRNDRMAKTTQREADLKFAEARNLKGISDQSPEKEPEQQAEQPAAVEQPVAIEQPLPAANIRTDVFSIENVSPYSDKNPIPPAKIPGSGLVYRIQLGAFSKAKPNNAFGGVQPVTFEQIPGSSIIKYYAGFFYSLNGVTKALETLRSQGFRDAFIVAFYEGKLITTEKAREIEFSGYKL